ncbi:calcium-binding protein [Thalassococcus lentus]|uniref:Calcium-binding protein n=1 Tax=Thalassococcus lentus TaxID=1210524 RepID=A0ABT4XRY5_9RHOB|nr:hypothetical protein [Thalassococcus lentus]MDA7424655.1 hypothetical protein [Thalassococcus lentus]
MATLVWDIVPNDFSITTGNGSWNSYTANWTNDFGITQTTFLPGDRVQFDNIFNTGNFTILVEEPVAPGRIDFLWDGINVFNYTFDGAPITISENITALGTGRVTINNPIVGSTSFQVQDISDFLLGGISTHTGTMDLITTVTPVRVTVMSTASWAGTIEVNPNTTLDNDGTVGTVVMDGGTVRNFGTISELTYLGGTVENNPVLGTINHLSLGLNNPFASGPPTPFTIDLFERIGNGSGRAVTGDYSANTLTVNGELRGDAHMRGGTDSMTVSAGATVSGDIRGGSGNDTISASGTVTGDIHGARDADTINIFGTVNGRIGGGGGNDTITVGGFVSGRIAGHSGDDTIDGTGAGTALFENGGSGNDSLVGGGFSDTIIGGSENDTLIGNGGNDRLRGDAGNDSISADAGDDTLFGGAGSDTLTGGTGSDRYFYSDTSQSAAGSSVDTIVDFEVGTDTIVLAGIDADTTAGGNQRFDFIGTAAFSGTAGELRIEAGVGTTTILGDTNGDSVADLQINLFGSLSVTAGDFIL